MENKNETFTYTYSAKQQEEIRNIRSKYLPKEEDKMEQLRRLEFEDIDRAMLAALEQSVGFVRHGGRPLDPMSAATLEDIRKTAAQKDGKVKV